MDRLHLKCALMDLLEHDLVILESEEDVAAVMKAARKLGYEVSAGERVSGDPTESSWVVTAKPGHETSVGAPIKREAEKSEVSAEV